MLKVVLPPFVNLTANIFQNPYTCFTLVYYAMKINLQTL